MFPWILKLLRRKPRRAPGPDLATAPEEPMPSERASSTRPANAQAWIGVDLDGTLAEATPWQGMTHIGPPVPLMLRRVRLWLEKGLRVKIVTARAGDPEGLAATQAWLKIHGLPELEVTDKKDFGMIELWDDRAIQVVQNTGVCFLGTSYFARPKAPILPDEIADRTFILVGSESKGASPGTKHSA
ncbi:MAG: hypothetical protein WCJ96_01095 [Verrucomicrobiota bacterium]|jgi:hypothetical protein